MKNIKCIFIGDGAVGKTSLIISYSTNCFPDEYVPTIFDDYCVDVIFGKKIVKLSLFDTSGEQKEYLCLRPFSYNKTDVVVLCYSIIRPFSLNNARYFWNEELRFHSRDVPIILVATKCDMQDMRKISYDEGLSVAKEIGAVDFIECSSLTGYNVSKVFNKIIEVALGNKENNSNKKSKDCILI